MQLNIYISKGEQYFSRVKFLLNNDLIEAFAKLTSICLKKVIFNS